MLYTHRGREQDRSEQGGAQAGRDSGGSFIVKVLPQGQSLFVKQSKCIGLSNTVKYFWYRLSNHVFLKIFDASSTPPDMSDALCTWNV